MTTLDILLAAACIALLLVVLLLFDPAARVRDWLVEHEPPGRTCAREGHDWQYRDASRHPDCTVLVNECTRCGAGDYRSRRVGYWTKDPDDG
jgi:hypothetical protein